MHCNARSIGTGCCRRFLSLFVASVVVVLTVTGCFDFCGCVAVFPIFVRTVIGFLIVAVVVGSGGCGLTAVAVAC